MATTIDYALMAGASYIDTRKLINQFSTPSNWVSFNHQTRDGTNGVRHDLFAILNTLY